MGVTILTMVITLIMDIIHTISINIIMSNILIMVTILTISIITILMDIMIEGITTEDTMIAIIG